jgi:hypothetical protein
VFGLKKVIGDGSIYPRGSITVQKTYQRTRSGTNYIIFQNAENFKQYLIVKEKTFGKETEEA